MVRRRDRNKPERSDVARTRKAIEEAFHSLLFKKEYDRITVTDVINEARISRGTFYAYYSDIRDLADCVGNKLVARIKDLIKDATMEHLMRDPRKMVETIIGDLGKNRERIMALFEKNGGSGLLEKLRSRLKESLYDEFSVIDEPQRSILISCVVGAVLDSCVDWVLSKDPCGKEEIIDTVTGFIANGTEYFSDRK